MVRSLRLGLTDSGARPGGGRSYAGRPTWYMEMLGGLVGGGWGRPGVKLIGIG